MSRIFKGKFFNGILENDHEKSYTMGCQPVRGDNPRALVSGLSYVQVDNTWYNCFILFVFVALRPMSTAMVIAGRSVHLTTLFPGQA